MRLADRILLVIGNGLSIDLFEYLAIELHPSFPFSFNVPFREGKLIDFLPHLRKMIASNREKNDYELIQDFVRNVPQNKEEYWTHYELREYLSIAYSYFNKLLSEKWKKNWKWQNWIKKRYGKILGVVSFNYDLVFETTMNMLSLEYYRLSSTEENIPQGVPIFKPHGSCDFDINPKLICIKTQKPFTIATSLNDINKPIEIVPKERLLEPRTQADIVLPFEFSPQTHLFWVRRGFKAITDIVSKVNRVIIVGLSYMACDRREINIVLDSLKKDVKIQYVCPNENFKLLKKLKKISANVERIDPTNQNDFAKII